MSRLATLTLALVAAGCAGGSGGERSTGAPRSDASDAVSVAAAKLGEAGASSSAGEHDVAADGSAREQSDDADRDAGPPPEYLGVVRGIVKLAPGAELPLAPPPTFQGQPPPSVAPCPPVDVADQRTVARGPRGGLSPVHVALTGMGAAPSRAARTHDVFIDACRLRPTLVGAMRGDSVRITNRSETALLPSIPGESFVRGLLRGESQEFALKNTQTVVRCTFGSYCGESLIVAVTHPLYAVTDGEGRFVIEQVPLDQQLTVHAWHPLFRVASRPFKLTRDAREQTIELALEPNPRALAKPDAGVAKGAPQPAKLSGKTAPPAKSPPKQSETPRGPAYE